LTPRAYSQGRRAASAGATRLRIVEAAAALYRERGVAGSTLAAIAARADVSRGTILHHFTGADGLVEAVADRVLEVLELPDERILDGIDDPEGRVRAFVVAMVRFFERSTPWWEVFQSEMQRPALRAREADYFAAFGRLQAAALGPAVAGDRIASATVGGLIHPGTLGALLWVLESAGLSAQERIDVIVDLLLGFITRHRVIEA